MSQADQEVCPRRLLIVDAMAVAFRSYYAFSHAHLQTSSGLPTGAVFGSALFLQRLLKEEQAHYLIIALDARGPTFRHELYPEYKANRSEMPDDLAEQMPYFKRLLYALGGSVLEIPRYEADDVIGTVAAKFASDDVSVRIVSGDKDFMQLVNEQVVMLTPEKGGSYKCMGPAQVVEKLGIQASQVVDYLALVGDSSDNVPGVRGIGPKGARQLLQDFGSLEGIYQNLDHVANGRVRGALQRGRDLAMLSRRLVTIATDIDLGVTLEHCRIELVEPVAGGSVEPDRELIELYRELEFHGLADERERQSRAAHSLVSPDTEIPALGERLQTVDASHYKTVTTRADLERLVAQFATVEEFAIDCETTGLDIVSDLPIGISLSARAGHAFYIPLLERDLTDLSVAQAYSMLAPVLGSRAVKFGHNLKFDLQMFANAGQAVKGPFVDTLILDYLLFPGGREHGLDACCAKHLRYKKIPTSDLIGGSGELSMVSAPLAAVSRYACEDADLTFRLAQHLIPLVIESGLDGVADEVEMPLIPVLADMERAGIYVDRRELARLGEQLDIMQRQLAGRIHQRVGWDINPNSPRQVQKLLFDDLQLHKVLDVGGIKKVASGLSTDESVLRRLSRHEVPRLLLEYREVAKLKNTYVDRLPDLIHPQTGRVHTQFQQAVTATGRLSSVTPNLQNIPIRTDLGRQIRRAFCSPDASQLIVSADYSQVELRVLAHLARDQRLCQSFADHSDIHAITAASLFGVALDQVTREQRDRAKAVNFGMIYGMGPRRLANDMNISRGEAQSFIQKYFAAFPQVKRFLSTAVEQGRSRGEARTLLGRRRLLGGSRYQESRPLGTGGFDNVAINTQVQGSAADLIKAAMIKVAAGLSAAGMQCRLLLSVHDELVFQCPKTEIEEATSLICVSMETALSLDVPLDVNVGRGANWLEAH